VSTSYINAALRRRVQEGARGCCQYCLLSESDAYFAHEPDHVIAEKHGGETSFENLARSCFDCNRFKGANIASIDPTTNELVPLFHPLQHSWSEHFRLVSGVIHPLTTIGRATERILRLNLETRIEIREILLVVGRYPGNPEY